MVQGALELIGVRAVIVDFRTYLNQGRQMEAATIAIGKATETVEKAALKTATAQRALDQVNQQVIIGNQRLSASYLQVVAARQRLSAAQATAASPAVSRLGLQGPAQANVASAQHALDIAETENKLAKASIPTIGAQSAARNAAAASALREAAAVDKLTAAEAKEADLAKSRTKLLTGTAAVAGGAAALGIGAASVKVASDYQQSLAKIHILTNTNQQDTEKLGKSLIDLSKEVPSSPNDLGAAAYFVLSSGIQDVKTALDITKISAKDSAIGLGSVADVAKNLTQIIVAYGTENITAAQASDILIAAAREGRAEAADFAGSLGRILPIASAIGVEFDQVAASMAVLTNGGLSADEAATGLRAIMNDLTKSSKQAEEALATVGLTANKVRQSIAEQGLTKTMLDLIQAFKGNLAAIEPIIPNIRGLVAASSAFISQGGKVDDVLKRIQNSAGTTDASFQEISQTLNFQVGLLKNEFSRALIEIGTALLPTITQAVRDLTAYFEKNKEAITRLMQQGLLTFIQVLKDVAAGVGFVIDVLSYIPNNEATITAAIIAIGAAFAWALPGSPYIKGLVLVLALMGQIQKGIDLPVVGGVGGDTAHTIGTLVGGGVGGVGGALLAGIPGGVVGGVGGAAAGNKIADLLFGEVEKKATATKSAIDPLDAAMDKFSKVTLPDLKRNTSGVQKADEALAKEMQKLTASFKSSSEAAGDVDDFTKKLKLFGEVEKDVADAFHLDAAAAGAVQAADAEEAALDRLGKMHFNYVKTLGTVATLIADGAEGLARQVVLGLARGALKSSQSALSAVLGGTTREVANLGVPLARSRLAEAQIDLRNNPQLYQLKQSSDAIDKDLKAVDKRQSDEEKKRKLRDDRLKDVFDKQSNILDAQLDALKYANQLAKNAAEVQAEKLQDLIDANKKAVSDLQAAFLKRNEAFQQQINAAIGQGNSGGALDLVRQQQDATRQFRIQNTGLNAAGGNLTAQQTAAERAEKERQRQAELAEQQLESQKKQLERQNKNIEALNKQTDSMRDLTLNTDRHKEALQASKDKIEEHIASLQHQKDVQDQVSQRLQDQIAVYEAQTGILKAQGEAADRTLLTQQEQSQVSAELIKQIGFESQAIRDLTTGPLGDLLTQVEDANLEFQTLQGAVQVLVDDKIRGEFTSAIDGMAKRNEILAAAENKAAGGAEVLGEALNNTAQKLKDLPKEIAASITGMEQQLVHEQSEANTFTTNPQPRRPRAGGAVRELLGGVLNSVTSIGSTAGLGAFNFRGFAEGGFTGSRGGIVHPHEVVLPLSNTARAREIFGQLPAGFASSLNRGRAGPSSIFGDLNVQGATLDDMRAVAHRAVDEAFSRSRRTAGNSGSLLSAGVGAGGF